MNQIIPLIVGAAGIVGAVLWGFLSGKKSARNEQAKAERVAIDKAKAIDNEISAMDDDDVNRRLTSWVRGGKR